MTPFGNDTPRISLQNTLFHNYISTTQENFLVFDLCQSQTKAPIMKKKPATLDAGQRMIVNSNIRRSVNKYFKSWTRLPGYFIDYLESLTEGLERKSM